MSTTDTLTVVKLLADGRTPEFTAQATGLKILDVRAIATKYGWPEEHRLRWAVDALTQEATASIPVKEPEPIPAALTTPAVRRGPSSPPPRKVPTAPSGVSPSGGGGSGLPVPASNGTTPPAPPSITVDELLRACRRSESKRTQSLGPKLTELVERIYMALRVEREAAEAREQQAAERAAAQAEVERLTKALAAAKARAAAATRGAVTEAAGEFTCPDCDRPFLTSQARGAHRSRAHGYRINPETTPRRTA